MSESSSLPAEAPREIPAEAEDDYQPTLVELLAESIPTDLTATPHVGIGSARRLKIAWAVLPVVEAAIEQARVESATGPALRNCLVPGCLAQYDAMAALAGKQPARPEWSSQGWRVVRHAAPAFPAGGHICPKHVEVVTTHLPRRAEVKTGWLQATCECGGWISPRLRWHGAVRGLWEEHLLDMLPTVADEIEGTNHDPR